MSNASQAWRSADLTRSKKLGNLVTGVRKTNATSETLWDLLVNVDRWPETFTPHLKQAHLEGPIRVGTNGWVRTKMLPNRFPFTVSSITPGKQWSWQGKMMWLAMDFDHRLEPSEPGTRVVFDVNLNGPLAATLRPLVRVIYRPQMERALDLLAQEAELGPMTY